MLQMVALRYPRCQAKRYLMQLAFCSNPAMATVDPIRQAFIALCQNTEGGHRAIAMATGLSEKGLWQVLNGTPLPSGNPRGLGRDARARLDRHYPGWMSGSTNGSVDVPGRLGKDGGFPFDGNVSEIFSRPKVPLISWVQAGLMSEVQDNFHPGEADQWLMPIYSKPGRNAFALRVDGDSMTSPYPGTISVPEGSVLIVDPDAGATAGDFVIAKDVTTQRATFKQLATDGGRWFLRALNPMYPAIEIDDPKLRVIGRVTEFQPPGRKL